MIFVRVKTTSQTIARILLVALVAGVSACAPLASVREVDARLGAQHGSAPELQRAELAIADAKALRRADPQRAIGLYLSAVEASSALLRSNSRDTLAERDYNFALARVFSVMRDAPLDPWTHQLKVPAPDGGDYFVAHRPSANRLWRPHDFDLIPADELKISGKFVVPRVTRAGLGVPLVAIRRAEAPTLRAPFLPPRIYFAVTAIAHFSGRRCEIEFIDPVATETVSFRGRSLPAAADFTAPMAVGLSREHPEKVAVPAMLNPDKFAEETRLIYTQPYDPNKIPVLLVHGLQATPVTWAPMVNTLSADPVLRRHYQVWVFSYPTGYPVPYSALLLRRQLEEVSKTYPGHRRIILVGHSMGGLLCRLMVSDSGGDKLWRHFFGKPPAQTQVSPEGKALLKEALIFRSRRDVAGVIFISTPHRGSMVAKGPIGRIASSLIHKSMRFRKLGGEIMHASVVQEEPGVLKLKRMPNSIDTLAPNDAFVQAMNNLPLARGIPYHSIIGDRGRGDTPRSSDGVVPYWSAHLEGAESETIVPSDHNANRHPAAIAEVDRILKKQVGYTSSEQEQPMLSMHR